MRTISRIADLRAELDGRESIGLVPTMGALHAGHLSLIERAREQCTTVVVSVFVNPTQFNDPADLGRYPRQLAEDAELAVRAGADLLFAPSPQEMYPEGFATEVRVSGITERLEGESRGAAHFHGVCTVVTKLLCIVRPHVAYFGQKDAQQALVIRRLVSDLNLGARVEVCPTVREPDGLAMSSRNVHLSADERHRATALFRALASAERQAREGERDARSLRERAAGTLAGEDLEVEYLALVDLQTLEDLQQLDRPALLALAGRVGRTRLIDNIVLTPAPNPSTHPIESEAATRCSV